MQKPFDLGAVDEEGVKRDFREACEVINEGYRFQDEQKALNAKRKLKLVGAKS